jgi:hypothetical protein
MDDFFKSFLDHFGPPLSRREVPPSSADRYRGHLPAQLLDYWQEFGWSGYAQGLFWMVNPQEYEDTLEQWLQGTSMEGIDTFHVIGRSAFGDLFLWGEKYGPGFTISPLDGYATCPLETMEPPEDLDEEIRIFFLCMSKEACDFDEMFLEAFARLGELETDQMYSFVPALALGGPRKVQQLQVVSMVEHLSFLAQIDDLEILRPPQ